MAENKFKILNAINVSEKIKTKNKLSYLPWADAWEEVKKVYPDANFTIYEQVIDEFGNTRPWHTDGHTGWVKVGVTIDNDEKIETLAIMDYKNNSIPAEQITSVDANKSLKRCFVKACALHGLGLYIYRAEDIPEEESKISEIKESIASIIEKKIALSDKAKTKVGELCRAAEKEAYPDFDDDLIAGNYKKINDLDILTKLKMQLMAVRK